MGGRDNYKKHTVGILASQYTPIIGALNKCDFKKVQKISQIPKLEKQWMEQQSQFSSPASYSLNYWLHNWMQLG